MFECVEKRLSRRNGWVLRCDGYREHSDLIVLRKGEGVRVWRKIECVTEQVRVLIGLVQPLGGVMMGGIPSYIGRLYVSFTKADIVVRETRCRWRGLALPEVGRGPWSGVGGDGPVPLRLVLPDAGVPLANKATPVLNFDRHRLAAGAELRGLIAPDGRG